MKYFVSTGDYKWQGEADSHDAAIRQALREAPANVRLGQCVCAKTAKRGTSRWAWTANMKAPFVSEESMPSMDDSEFEAAVKTAEARHRRTVQSVVTDVEHGAVIVRWGCGHEIRFDIHRVPSEYLAAPDVLGVEVGDEIECPTCLHEGLATDARS